MLTPKPCRYCESVWHSKNKCPNAPERPQKLVYNKKATIPPTKRQNVSDRPKLAYKGKSDRSQLIGYADKYFSLYIRGRGSDGEKNTCYTCGVLQTIDQLQNGHFIHRRYLKTRWHELNCWPQCNECNVVKGGNLELYEAKLRQQFGDDAVDGLKRLAQSNEKFTEQDIQAVIDRHKSVVF